MTERMSADEPKTFVHDHGVEEGDGLACHELRIGGHLIGNCLLASVRAEAEAKGRAEAEAQWHNLAVNDALAQRDALAAELSLAEKLIPGIRYRDFDELSETERRWADRSSVEILAERDARIRKETLLDAAEALMWTSVEERDKNFSSAWLRARATVEDTNDK